MISALVIALALAATGVARAAESDKFFFTILYCDPETKEETFQFPVIFYGRCGVCIDQVATSIRFSCSDHTSAEYFQTPGCEEDDDDENNVVVTVNSDVCSNGPVTTKTSGVIVRKFDIGYAGVMRELSEGRRATKRDLSKTIVATTPVGESGASDAGAAQMANSASLTSAACALALLGVRSTL
jgi:hypothetical protein